MLDKNKPELLGENLLPSTYQQEYNPDILFPIPRKVKRDEIGIKTNIFAGVDIWNAYELSWLNLKGKPQVAIAQFFIDANSENIIESKSFKLYLNSLNQTHFLCSDEVKKILIQDIKKAVNGNVNIEIIESQSFDSYFNNNGIKNFDGIYLDRLDIDVSSYEPDRKLLFTQENHNIEEVVYSDLLKSNCLVTGQPDWASIQIGYTGKQINHEGLLKYLIGFRNHQEFHEQCVERIFNDILTTCQPIKLWVYAKYTRRGGLDINPFRTNTTMQIPKFTRHARQ